MLLSVALLPEPVGPNRNRCAFICRSRRFNGSKVIGPPPRLKNVMPGCPVPWLRPQTGARFAACCANMSWVPLALVGSRIEHARQPAQIAVQRRHLVLFAYRLQAGVEHHVDELQAARIELGQVAAAQVERQRAAVELVRAADQAARLLHVPAGLLRGQGLADGLPGEVVEVRSQHVLGVATSVRHITVSRASGRTAR